MSKAHSPDRFFARSCFFSYNFRQEKGFCRICFFPKMAACSLDSVSEDIDLCNSSSLLFISLFSIGSLVLLICCFIRCMEIDMSLIFLFVLFFFSLSISLCILWSFFMSELKMCREVCPVYVHGTVLLLIGFVNFLLFLFFISCVR